MISATLHPSRHKHLARWSALLFGLWVLVSAMSTQALISTYADPRTLDEMESLRLTLRVEGKSQAGDLDLAPLEAEFEVLGSNTSSQYRSINGQVQSWVEYQITLRPKVTGTVTIPPISINGEQSQRIEINVNPLDSTIKQAIEEMVYFENELSSPSVYVQSELVFTRRLFYSTSGGVQMYSDLPGAPLIKDAVVVTLGQTEAYNESRNGLKYGVVEQRFAIIPEKSGQLTIPKVAITSSIRLMKQGRVRRSGIRVNSEEVTVDVLPIPTSYPADKPWLAASAVELAEVWEPRPATFIVGEPLTRQIVARVTGNVASAIPPLNDDANSGTANAKLKQYPQAPELRDDSGGRTNVGTRTEKYSILPSEAGSSRISPITLTWWDTDSNQLRESRLEARQVQVAANPKLATTPQQETVAAEELNTGPTSLDTSDELGTDQETQAQTPKFSILTWSAAAVGLCLLGFAWVNRQQLLARARRLLRKLNPPEPLSVDGQPKVRQPNPSRALGTLKKLSSTTDAHALRQQMIEFICLHDGITPVGGEAVARLQQNPVCRALLASLDKILYSASSTNSATATGTEQAPTGAAVRSALEAFAAAQVQQNTAIGPHLPQLYPT